MKSHRIGVMWENSMSQNQMGLCRWATISEDKEEQLWGRALWKITTLSHIRVVSPLRVGTALLGSTRGTEADVQTAMKERTYALRSVITMDNRGLLDNLVPICFVLYLLLMCLKFRNGQSPYPPLCILYPPWPMPLFSCLCAWHVSLSHVLLIFTC